jgi:hypothetical protein
MARRSLYQRCMLAVLPIGLALLAGCRGVRESDAYEALPPPVGHDARERAIARFELEANRGAGPSFTLMHAGAGPSLPAHSRATFLIEALTPEGAVAQREELRILTPDPFDPEGFGSETGAPAPRVCADVCWPMQRQRGFRVVQNGGSLGFATVFVSDMRVGEVRTTRGGQFAVRSLGETAARTIRRVRGKVHVSASVLRPEGMVTIDRWDPAEVEPELRITLLSACRADLRLVQFTHVRHVGISYAQLPLGTVTHHWYEDRGCRR